MWYLLFRFSLVALLFQTAYCNHNLYNITFWLVNSAYVISPSTNGPSLNRKLLEKIQQLLSVTVVQKKRRFFVSCLHFDGWLTTSVSCLKIRTILNFIWIYSYIRFSLVSAVHASLFLIFIRISGRLTAVQVLMWDITFHTDVIEVKD